MKLARLNENGIATFSGWLDAVRQGGAVQAPASLIANPAATEALAVDVEVEQRTFANRFEVAEYLFSRFTSAGLTDVDRDRGLWAWLSLFYLDCVCPLGKGGARKPGAQARHIPEPGNFRLYYRHLLGGPFRIYRAHRDDPKRAMALLCQPIARPGDVVEQLASRQEVVTNPGILELATKLYVSKTTQRLKPLADGSARRLIDVLNQFDLTWDLYSSTGAELAAVMPKEFARFLV